MLFRSAEQASRSVRRRRKTSRRKLGVDAKVAIQRPLRGEGQPTGLLVDGDRAVEPQELDEEIARVFLSLPDDDERLAPILGRGEEVREQLRLLTHAGSSGRVIRTHGDYHLGQTLWSGNDWVLLDFEGEPARTLVERRRKRSPLRDVAGMLRSFAYAATAAELTRDADVPEDWEERARERFLESYLETVDPALMPAGDAAIERLLAVFELEKAVYELRYELNNRPHWVQIPVAGIVRMLEEEVPV